MKLSRKTKVELHNTIIGVVAVVVCIGGPLLLAGASPVAVVVTLAFMSWWMR